MEKFEAYLPGHGWVRLTSATLADAQAAARAIRATKVRDTPALGKRGKEIRPGGTTGETTRGSRKGGET